MDVEGRVTAFGILGVPVVSQISNTPQQTHTLGEPVHLWRHVYRRFLRMKASESVHGDKSGEPLIARCYLGGGRGWGGGDNTVSLLVPLWTRWDNNDGVWEVCGWGRGVCVCVPTPPAPPPALPSRVSGEIFVWLLCRGWGQPDRSPEEGVSC